MYNKETDHTGYLEHDIDNYYNLSAGLSDKEFRVSLGGMPPGDYYIDIHQEKQKLWDFYENNRRGSYELEFSNIDEFVQSDPYEPNNSIKRAEEIDTKTNDILTLKNLSLNSYYDVDTFKFTNVKQADSSHYIKLTQYDKIKLPELGIQIFDEKGHKVLLGHEAQFYTNYGARGTTFAAESTIEEYSFNVDNYWTKYVNLNTLPKGEYYISVYAENESDHLFWTHPIVNNKLGRSHSFDKDWSIDDYELTISTPSYCTSIVEDIYEEYEENSIINLGLLNNNYIKQDLTFHTPQDLDIRRFTTSTIGTATDGIGVRFDQEEGEVYLDLYRVYENNDKTLIRQSITSSSDGWLTFDQLPIGSY